MPEVITSCGSSVVIKFHSSGYDTATGFRAEWEELTTSAPCSSNRDNPSSDIPDNLDQVEPSVIHTMQQIIMLLLQEWTHAPENGGEF